MQRRCVRHAVIVIRPALLHYQQGRRLGQMAIQQFIELMTGIDPGHDHGAKPNQGNQPQHQNLQARLQGAQSAPPTHAASGLRSTV